MITVLLAVYNGEKFLKPQIESILNQTVRDIKILIRDDGSNDKSPEIIAEYASKFPNKISVIKGEPTGSAVSNFGEMLKQCDDDYIMFADQDDVWFEDKVQKTFDAMLKAESEDPDLPVLVHTDLVVTDSELNTISDSFFNYQKIIPEDLTINKLLVQNYVTGCTVMINRILKNRAIPIPESAAMHDWWLALAASAFGKIVTVNQPLMYYRQHGQNHVGAKAGSGFEFIIRKIKTINTVRDNYDSTYRQAELLLKSYDKLLSDVKRETLNAYIAMRTASRIAKIKTINKYNFKKCTVLRVLGQYILS